MKKSKLIKSMLVLAALLLSVGQMWGQSFTFENSNSTTSVTTNNITYTCKGSGTSTTRFGSSLKFMNLGSGKQMQFVSTTNNISRIEIKACANNSAAKKCMTIKTSADASSYSVPSTFTATLDGSSAESVEDMSLTGTSASDWQTLVINFNANATLPMAFQILRGSNNLSVYSVKVYTAPTALATSDVTSEGVTFTVTDGASTNNYDIYYSKSTSVPNSGTSASTTISSAKTKSITGLESGQTYYAWVRSTWSSGTIKGDWRPSTASVSFTTESAGGGCGSTEQAALTLSSSSGTICGTGTATFTVSGGSGSGALSVSSSAPSKATASISGSTVTVTGVAAGSATITVTKACDATYAEKTATYSATVAAAPSAAAGADKTTEPGTGVALAATAAASGCTGAWTIQSGPNTSTAQLSSTSSATATFTPTVAGTYALRWTVTNTSSSCSAYDEMTVSAAVCSISDCGNATLTYPIYTSGDLTTSNLFSGASSTNATAVSVGASPTFEGVTVSAATKGSSANAGACYAKSTALTGKMKYSASSKSSSYYIDFPFTVNTGYTFTPCDVQVVIQPVSSNQAFTVEITDGTNVYGTSTATLNAGVMEPIIGLTSTAEMSAGNYAVRLYPHGGSSKEFRMGANVILKGTTAAAAPSCTAPNHVDITGAWDKFGGETISLTATAYSSAGTGSPIADGNITGWQWEKLIGSTWTALSNGTAAGVTTSGATTKNLQISNCGQGNSGKYRCVVSTGATCSTASATATDGSEGYVVKVYALECYTGGTTVYNFTRDGNNQRGSVEVDLAARAEGHEFKIHADKYYGNNGTINFDENNWTFTVEGNNVTVNSGLGGTFTFTIDYSSNGDVPVLAVTYPRKRIYLEPNSDWLSNSAKFAYYYFHKTGDDTDAEGWTDFLTEDDCGMYADIPQWNGVKMIAVRFNPSDATPGWNGDGHVWNQTSDLTVTSNDLITITGWNNSQTYNSTYSTPTYTIGYAKGSVPTGGGSISGSKSNETKTCGVDFTLPSSAVFTTTGYTQTGWTTSNGGAQEYALGGTYTTNEDKTFYPVWTVNNYDLTWNLGGGTTTSTGTGIASGVSVNTTTSQAYGTALTAPTVTKTGYNFSAWSPAVAATMPAANTTYTATWAAKTTTITINANTANHGSSTPGTVTATYGNALPLFTAASGVSGFSLTGYYTDATSGTKVINADGTLVAGTDYADGSGNWKYETATLTLYAQYEEEGCTPTTASITFNNNVAGKYNTAWVAGDITTSGGATYTLTNTSCDTGHPMTKPAIKGAKNKTLIQINIPAGATSGTISVSAATYEGGAATLAITNSGGSVLASQSLSGTTTNPEAGSWSAPTLKTASYNITAGGTYYIKETSNSNNIYIYAFSATAEVPCDETAPTFVSSVPANGATGVATSGTIVLTFSEALGSVDASKFTLTGATKGAVSIDGSDATKVNIAYSGAANEATVTLATAAAAVSDLAGNTLAAALSNISFTTAAAEPEALVHWTLNLNSNTWGTSTTPTTTDGTNITSISTSADSEDGTREGTTKKVSLASASDNVDKAASFTFTVNSAKKVEPERVTCQVFNVGGSSGGQLSYKAQLSDNNGHIYYSTNTVVPASEATLTDATFTFASDLVLTGNVTIKVYGWKSGSAGSAFRMGADVKLFGEVQNAADYTVTHTLSNVTKSAGATSVKEGNNYTATYAGAGGFALPSTITVTIGGSPATAGTDYTWTQGTGVVSIPGNKVIGNIVITVTGVAVVHHDVTFSLTNVVYSSGDNQGTDAATEGSAFSTVFAASSGYDLPSTITVTIGGSPATVSTDYTWNSSTGALEILAASVTGDIVVTIVGPEHVTSDCITIAYFETTSHNNSSSKPDNAGKYIYGYTNSAKTEAYAYTITSSTGDNKGQGTGESDYLRMNYGTTVTIYADNTTTGGTPATFSNVTSVSVDFKMKSSSYYTSFDIYVGATKIADNVSLQGDAQTAFTTFTYDGLAQLSGTVRIVNKGSGSSNYHFYVDNIEICTASMDACTTPVIPTLSNQTVCPGSDIEAWNATQTAVLADGETASYSWKKKGNDTELANTASFDLGSSATEGMAGTYVVTVTVSKTGYISKSASAEVDLTVTPATEEPSVSANKATVYDGNSVTLTATCGSSGTITWAWYTCNSDGTGESAIGGATSNSYAIASAPAAGTYYYKVKATGDGTNACGTAEYVYTLTVSEASGTCNMMTIFDGSTMSSAPASTSGTESTSGATWTAVGTATEMSSTVSMEYSGKTYTKGWKFTGGATTSSSRYIQIVIPTGYTGDLVMNGFIGSTSRSVFVATSPTGTLNTSIAYWSPATTNTLATATTRLSAGTYYVCATNSAFLTELSVNVCGDEVCTDEKPTATATNNTVCSGSTLTITATGYESDPTSIQWQKKNGESWDNISGATSATYSVASAAAADAGTYRVQVTKGCTRNSNEVTITIPSAPVFGDVPSSVTIMQTIALSISTVEASDAASYKWYKSADATWDAGDAEICDTKNLLKAYEGEAIGSPSYYVFCRATNSCGTETSSAIAVNVTAYVAEDCAERGGEDEAQFGFENTGCSQGTYSETAVWTTNSRSKYLTYTAPDGKYFKTAKVTVAVTSGAKCGYAYSTNGGTTWTYAELTSLSSTLTEKTINLSALGGGVIDAFRISRNLQDGGGTDHGVTSGNFHLSKACFEYTESCTATTVTPSGTGSETHTIGDSFTEPTFTVKHGGTAFDPQPEIIYTSSNEDIATVDDDGTVNFQGMAGSVTITAAYAGDATYCASEGHYTITVSCSDEAPKIVAASSVDLSGCNSSVVLNAKKQDGSTSFGSGTYQWYRDGEAISGATSASYTAVQAGVYTVERTNSGCTNLSSNSATVTSATVEPEIEHLAPFQYYHVDKTYSAQMKMRHLFTVKGSAAYGSTGKNFKMELSKNSAAATDVTTSNAFVVWQSADKTVDTVMIDLNKLYGKYAENDELVLTCKAVDCEGNVSTIYKDEITIHVIGSTPTLALILNGKDSKVGGDFLEDYEPKNLQEQTGSKTWSGEWPMYTDLKTAYNVTPVNGYAPFNKLNYEPFDIIFLTDFPKASKSDATKTLLDDMYELVDFRPMFSFKTHMLWKSPSKWASKGFTAAPVVPKGGDGRTKMNIVCYAHPMFEAISGSDGTETQRDASDPSQIVYKMLSDVGYESSKGIQGFEIEAAEHFVTIGLIHYNAGSTDGSPSAGQITWSPNAGDRMLVAAAERQANPEARMILLSLNAGAHSKLTAKGRLVVMKSLEYLIQTSGGLIEPADCSYTFDNGEGYSDYNASEYAAAGLHGTKGDGKWSTEANWGPGRNALPGQFTSVRIAAPVTVDMEHAHVMETRIVEGGSIEIPAGKGLEVTSTVRHLDGAEISPTGVSELTLEASTTSNGTLIFNNNTGDSKATVWAYSKGFISEGVKNYQYIGTPFNELNALYNYYGSWIYSWSYNSKKSRWGWVAVKNGGPMHAWTGYCISQESPTYYETSGTMTATGMVDIAVPAGENMVVGNSWTAPLYIKEFTDDDFENLVGNVYFFNTGVDKTGEGTTTVSATGDARWTGGTYVSIPIHASSYTGDSLISSMQGFFVKSNGSAGALHLDYDRHVRPSTNRNILSGELHAPARRAAFSSDEPTVLKIKVSGENYDDKLLLLEREDFSEGFDNGWDGDKWDGNESALYIYTTDSEGTENSVSAIPELEGTVIGFRAGEDDAYTLNFEYLNSDEPLYLYDVENNTYTQIMTGMTYRFFTTDNEKHERFIITRSNGQEVPTDIGNGEASGGARAKKFILNDKMYIMINGMLYDATGKVVK